MLRTCCNFYNTLEVNDFTELEQHKLMKRSGLSPKLVIFQWRNLDRLLNADLRDILTVKGFSSLRTHAYRTPYCTEYHYHFFWHGQFSVALGLQNKLLLSTYLSARVVLSLNVFYILSMYIVYYVCQANFKPKCLCDTVVSINDQKSDAHYIPDSTHIPYFQTVF